MGLFGITKVLDKLPNPYIGVDSPPLESITIPSSGVYVDPVLSKISESQPVSLDTAAGSPTTVQTTNTGKGFNLLGFGKSQKGGNSGERKQSKNAAMERAMQKQIAKKKGNGGLRPIITSGGGGSLAAGSLNLGGSGGGLLPALGLGGGYTGRSDEFKTFLARGWENFTPRHILGNIAKLIGLPAMYAAHKLNELDRTVQDNTKEGSSGKIANDLQYSDAKWYDPTSWLPSDMGSTMNREAATYRLAKLASPVTGLGGAIGDVILGAIGQRNDVPLI